MTTSPCDCLVFEIEINPFRKEWAKSKTNQTINLFANVIVQIAKQTFFGRVSRIKNIETADDLTNPDLPIQSEPADNSACIIRLANDNDYQLRQTILKKNEETKSFFEYLLKKFKISAKVVLVDWDLSQHKVYCYVTSERKINYLLLHETAVDSLKARVAIKQIGIRDFARSIGGLGVCGRELCCRSFMRNIQSITLTIAREQGIYIDPEKITGCCGKLRCCLVFEKFEKSELEEKEN